MSASEGEWRTIDPDTETLEEGDLIETRSCVQLPQWLSGQEAAARLAIGTAELTGQYNNELPECMTTEVISTELVEDPGAVVEGDECEFMYVVRYRVAELREGCHNITVRSSYQALIAAILVVAAIAGIALVFYEARKFIETPGGEETARNVSTALLLAAAAWAFSQFAGSDDDGLF